MRSTIVLFILGLIIVTVQAASLRTNAERMARGLPPRAPAKLYNPTPVAVAKRNKPSGKPDSCPNGKPIQCCQEITTADNELAKLLLGVAGVHVPPNTPVGLTCSPISSIGIISGLCSPPHAVCCDKVELGGLIDVNCEKAPGKF